MRVNSVNGPFPRAPRRLLPWLVLMPGLALAALPALPQEAAPDGEAASEPEAIVPSDGEAASDPETAEPADGTEDGTETLPVTRFEAELAFDRLRAVEDFGAAIGIGERMVELTVEEFGAESVETGNAYADLGAVQREAGDYEAALESYLRAVEIMRDVGGPYSEPLIEPLVGLGDTYQADGQHLEAVSAYDQAHSANRRVLGLLNEQQFAILDSMTESFYEMDELSQADEQQLDALRIAERIYEPHSDEMLEAIYDYARWLRRSNRFTAEREQYVRAMRTIREHYGEEDVRLVEPLRRTANSFRHQRAAHGEGISSLNEALEILSAQENPDPLRLATVLRDIGDWKIAFSNTSPDNSEYRRAWELLGDVEGGTELRAEWFGGVHFVLREPHSGRGLSEDADAVQGSVVVRLDIDEAGRSNNIAVVESDPPGFKDEAFVRQVQRSRFRPHMQDGVVVPARRLGLRFTFPYLPDELEDDEDD